VVRSSSPLVFGLLGGLAGVGVVLSHSYEVLVVLVLGASLAVSLGWRRGALRGLLQGAAAGAVAAGIGIAPYLSSILGAGDARATRDPLYPGKFGAALRFWVTNPENYVLYGYPTSGHADVPLSGTTKVALAVTLVALVASPLALAVRRLAWVRPWFVTWFVISALGLWTTYSTSGPAQFVAGLWYGNPERVKTMIRPCYSLLALAGACFLGYAAHWLASGLLRRMPRRSSWPKSRLDRIRPSVAAGMAFFLVVSLLAIAPGAWRPVRSDFGHRYPHGASYPRVFQWLAANTDPGMSVAYDRHLEFMTWSYADYGVTPLFGIPPLDPQLQNDYRDRMLAFKWLADSKNVKAAGCLVDRFRVQYVVVGGPNFPAWTQHYSSKRIVTSPRLQLVHRDGALRVYEVDEAGRRCES